MLKTDTKEHYKMYKSGKQMVNAMLLSALIATGSLALGQTAKANTAENTANQPVVQTAVNSTAQPTVNSAASSTVGSASQVSSTSSSVSSAAPVAQTSQPASTAVVDTFNVSRNSTPVTNVTQSLVQTNQNNQAQVTNVNVQYTNDSKETSFAPGRSFDLTATYDFDINIDQAQLNQRYLLGHWEQSSSTNRNAGFQDKTYQNPVFYKSQQIGYLEYADSDAGNSTSDNLYFTLTKKPKAVGMVHLSVTSPSELKLNVNHARNFRGVLTSQQVFKFVNNENKITTSINYTIQQPTYDYVHDSSETQFRNVLNNLQKHQADFATIGGNGHLASVTNITFPELSLDDVAKAMVNDNTTTPLPLQNKTYQLAQRVYLANGGTLLNQQREVGTSGSAWGVDSDGHYLMYTQPATSNTRNSNIKLVNLTGAYTLAQMKAMTDSSQDTVLISPQNDGSLLYYFNLTPKFFVGDKTYEQVLADANNWETVNADKDPDKAAQISAKVQYDILHSQNSQLTFWNWASIADPTVKTQLKTQSLDPNTGAVINEASRDFTPNSYMASGQSAVKLHVINATNGADLKHLIHFIISPIG